MISKNLCVSFSYLNYNFWQYPSMMISMSYWFSYWKLGCGWFLISWMNIYSSIREQFSEFMNFSITLLNCTGLWYSLIKISLNCLKMNYFLCLFYKKNTATKSYELSSTSYSVDIFFLSKKLFYNINLWSYVNKRTFSYA